MYVRMCVRTCMYIYICMYVYVCLCVRASPVLLSHGQSDRSVSRCVRHVEEFHCPDVQQHLAHLLVPLQGCPMDGCHALRAVYQPMFKSHSKVSQTPT